MTTPLLIITTDIPFGEFIRQGLEETGQFVVRVAESQKAIQAYGRDYNPALAFLDTSLPESELLKIGALLRKVNPEIIFVVVSETGWHLALEELFPRETLSKPLYLPHLLEMMEKYFSYSPTLEIPALTANIVSDEDIPWLSDVTRAAQHLTRLTLESSAQAALITRTDQLWAYAGQLPQSAARELADTLTRYWDPQEENDLVRFVRLTSTNAEHMLYATRLAEGMVLALVFDAETPFSTIRTQASQLVHSLSNTRSDRTPDQDPANREPDLNSLSDPSASPSFTDPEAGSNENEGIPVPGLRRQPRPASVQPFTAAPQFGRRVSPAERMKLLLDTDQAEAPPAPQEQDVQVPTESRKNRSQDTGLETEPARETRSRPAPEVGRKIVLEPVTPAVYNLDYACLLVPRFPHHHMTGDLLDRLGEWVPQICIAYGLRLEYISVRPDYLQWIVNVPPATSPAYLMRTLRQHTSENIFAEFPRFKKDNPSGDFWAPGYLIMGGSQPPPAQLIKDFITQTRQRQGITQINN